MKLGTVVLFSIQVFEKRILEMSSVYGRLPAEIMGSNPTGGMVVCLL